jgi:hypothetical protein
MNYDNYYLELEAIFEASARRDFRNTPSKRRLLRKYTLEQLWDVMLFHCPKHPNWGAAYDVAPGAGRRPRCPQRNAKQRRFVRRQWRDLPF